MMSRQALLRTNALYLLVAATGGMCADLAGAFVGYGPLAKVLVAAPDAAIGFVEAHGLALIFGCLLWHAEPSRKWHLTAAMIHGLLGTANIAFWQLFITTDTLPMGYVTTSLHALFFTLQLAASSTPRTQINVLSTRNQRPVKAGRSLI
jgi:hypothetical protein